MNQKTNTTPFFARIPLLRLLAVFLLTICSFGANIASAQVDRIALERVYRGWVGSMVNKNYDAYKRYTAAHRQAITHNIVVSRKDAWPKAMFALPIKHPQITTLTYVDTVEKGPTAHLIYFGKVDFGLLPTEIPNNILVLKFVKEASGWKFDRTQFFNLKENPEILARAKVRDFGFTRQDDFQPDGILPEVPRKIFKPDYVGEAWIGAVGYEVTFKVGDLHETVVKNNVVTDLVIGGLSKAGKPVKIEIKKLDIPEEVPRRMEIAIYALRPGATAKRVWYYRPPLDQIPENHTANVYANAVTLRDR